MPSRFSGAVKCREREPLEFGKPEEEDGECSLVAAGKQQPRTRGNQNVGLCWLAAAGNQSDPGRKRADLGRLSWCQIPNCFGEGGNGFGRKQSPPRGAGREPAPENANCMLHVQPSNSECGAHDSWVAYLKTYSIPDKTKQRSLPVRVQIV